MRKGYTLIEMLLVLAILSIFFGIGLPKTNYFMNIQERKEIENFRKDLLLTRNKAIVESRNYIVIFDLEGNRYGIAPQNNQKGIRYKSFNSGIKIDRENIIKTFTFMYNGTTKNSGTLYLNNKRGQEYAIKLSPVTGRIGIVMPDDK